MMQGYKSERGHPLKQAKRQTYSSNMVEYLLYNFSALRVRDVMFSG